MKNNIGEAERGKATSALRLVWRVVRPILVTYLLVLLAMTFVETWLVYPIPPVDRGDRHPVGFDYEEVWFKAADGTMLFGWFAPQAGSKRAVLYCHGNGEDVSRNVDTLVELRRQLDANVFLFDYRGYGRSEGRPTEAGCIADGVAADQWLANRLGLKPTDVIVMGRSLGGAIAVAVAAEEGAQTLVLDSTFSRMTDAAAYHYPWLPVRLVMQNRYDSIARIQQFNGPVFQSHGAADTIVPLALAKQLFAAIPSDQKAFREYPGRDHSDPFPQTYLSELRSFLDRIAPSVATQPNSSRP